MASRQAILRASRVATVFGSTGRAGLSLKGVQTAISELPVAVAAARAVSEGPVSQSNAQPYLISQITQPRNGRTARSRRTERQSRRIYSFIESIAFAPRFCSLPPVLVSRSSLADSPAAPTQPSLPCRLPQTRAASVLCVTKRSMPVTKHDQI